MTTVPRAALINGLRDLAAFLEASPEVPIPSLTGLSYYARGTDTDIRAEIDAIATLLDTEVDTSDLDHGHYRTYLAFGPVEYTAVGIFAAARARHKAETSYAGCIDPAPLTPAA
ncbi:MULTISPECIES: hypothetical protein [Streptosporangium]|uniref:Uncharacterized protein n=1 Tax=Streptosporangium brasiliense TaxID=47480 RepID=A0ABT9R7P1_9ACTN|nr:hypothetical protein [Streptosporangium brasiliense]MDP9864906.1 hypothetical protein [Streptosporangium brasiliense]